MNFTKRLLLITSTVLSSLLLLSSSVKADELTPAFNNIVGDQEFLQGRNLTQGGNYTDPVFANAKEEVEVAVYYHNTVEGSTAQNVNLKINIPTEQAAQHTISGLLSASNAQSVSGTIINGQEIGQPNLTVISNGLTTINFVPGSVRWYPNRLETSGPGVNLPNAQDGNSIIASGINLGDIQGCFQYSGFVKFRVTLEGQPIINDLATLRIVKDIRRGATSDVFIDRINANPGNNLEYKIMVENIDGVVSAKQLHIKDQLPSNLTYLGPTFMRYNGQDSQLPDGIVGEGIVVLPELKAGEKVELFFLVKSDANISNDTCLVNKAIASSPTVKNAVEDTAVACFIVPTPPPVKPTPTPIPPTNPPITDLPSSGPEQGILMTVGLAGLSGLTTKYWSLRNKFKKQSRHVKVI